MSVDDMLGKRLPKYLQFLCNNKVMCSTPVACQMIKRKQLTICYDAQLIVCFHDQFIHNFAMKPKPIALP